MTIKIREGVFETNSSSVHTLVFHKVDINNTICTDEMKIRGGYYGRCPQAPLTTIEERLNYLGTGIGDNCINDFDYEKQEGTKDEKELEDWKNIIHIYCPNAILYDLSDVQNSGTGIDHSVLLKPLLKAMKKDGELLRYFLLDPEGCIFISGDEYDGREEKEYFDPWLVPRVGGSNSEKVIHILDDNKYIYTKGN